jgi:hypothetical protein
MCLRWQNALLLLLPAWDTLRALRRGGSEAMVATRRTSLLGAAALAGAWPQMAAWKSIYGEWLLRYPPHGADFLRIDHPYVLQTLFSSRRPALWTPVFWAGYLGYFWLLRQRGPRPDADAAAPGHDLREHVLRRLVGGRVVLEPEVRQPPSLALGLAGGLEWAPRRTGIPRSRSGPRSCPRWPGTSA